MTDQQMSTFAFQPLKISLKSLIGVGSGGTITSTWLLFSRPLKLKPVYTLFACLLHALADSSPNDSSSGSSHCGPGHSAEDGANTRTNCTEPRTKLPFERLEFRSTGFFDIFASLCRLEGNLFNIVFDHLEAFVLIFNLCSNLLIDPID